MLKACLLRCTALSVLIAAAICAAQKPAAHITTEKEFFGFTLGDDYHLANYTQSVAYWKKLATETDRMKIVDIGPTSEDRRQVMAIITSPENMKKLDHYKEIARKLALAEGVSTEQARALAHEGKSIVWIDGGLHSNEVVGQTQIVDLVYHLVNDADAETMRELNDDIVLCVMDNPDGIEMIADWYMRDPIPAPRKEGEAADPGGNSSFGVPHLWSHYAGHDDNRDFFMANLRETTNINRVLFRDWYPQIMYNHHQAGPAGTVIFVPPFRDPFNYHFDPLMPIKIEEVGMAIHNRLIEEGKPGSTMRSGATYSTWYNGGLRTVTYFHNMIGILTEIIGSPIPGPLPLVPNEQLPRNDLPDPISPQVWHFSQSIAYELTNNRAILDYASRNKEELLFDEYKMASNSIQRGNEDSWTVTSKRIAALEAAAKKEADEKAAAAAAANPGAAARGRAGAGNGPGGAAQVPGGAAVPEALYKEVLHDPVFRDPRGYIVPSDQVDFSTATKFINTLLKNGVTVMRASADFTVAGNKYPKDSYVVKAAQAYRPHILDMFEPQDHPDDFKYPGGPPIPPYDVTGYTLAYQMGVQFDRVMEAFDGPFVPITTDLVTPPPGTIAGATGKFAGYLVSHQINDGFILTNRLLKAKLPVFWIKTESTVGGKDLGAGAIWIPESAAAKKIVDEATAKLGITAYAMADAPKGAMMALKAPRIALYDQYGGLMPTGWARYEFEQFEFPYTVVYPQELDAGKLHDKYDVLILPDGAVSATLFVGGMNRSAFSNRQPAADKVPADVRPLLGVFSKEKTVPALDAFVKDGGEIITIGSSNRLSELLALPVRSALTEIGPDGKDRELPGEKFYIPGSLIKAHVDSNNPVAFGMPSNVDMFFDRSPAFHLSPDAGIHGATVIAWYGRGDLLDSGWAWGQHYLQDSLAAVRIPDGKGSVILLGPEVMFRGQPHATFKLLFNGVFLSAAQ
jgi:hypothetical protein